MGCCMPVAIGVRALLPCWHGMEWESIHWQLQSVDMGNAAEEYHCHRVFNSHELVILFANINPHYYSWPIIIFFLADSSPKREYTNLSCDDFDQIHVHIFLRYKIVQMGFSNTFQHTDISACLLDLCTSLLGTVTKLFLLVCELLSDITSNMSMHFRCECSVPASTWSARWNINFFFFFLQKGQDLYSEMEDMPVYNVSVVTMEHYHISSLTGIFFFIMFFLGGYKILKHQKVVYGHHTYYLWPEISVQFFLHLAFVGINIKSQTPKIPVAMIQGLHFNLWISAWAMQL